MVLSVEGVTKKFGGLTAVRNVHLRLGEREVCGLIGPNGAGKTTLLNVIAGAYKPDGGRVRLGDEDITGLAPERVCRKGIARTFQICRPFAKMTVLENVEVAARFGRARQTGSPKDHAAEMLAFVDFPVSLDTVAGTLNAVQMRRLDMARALASDPKVLLLDEVAAGLNTTELLDLRKLIRRITEREVTVLMVEHLMRLIMACCDRIVVLDHGEWIAEGTAEEIARNPLVTSAYLGESDD